MIKFQPNKTTATVKVAVKGDKIFEPSESFYLKLSKPTTNGAISKDEVKATIANDDPQPLICISVSDSLVSEQVIIGFSFNPILNDFNVSQNDF